MIDWRRLLGKRYVPPEEQAYERLKLKGFRPGGIIDVGAYEGHWTRMARRIFPDAPVLMVEAQPGKAQHLQRVCDELSNVRSVHALLAGETGKTIEFFVMETGSSMFPERSDCARSSLNLTTTMLDEVAADMAGPLFLKIDVQGAELEVLSGGAETLNRCEVVQLEVPLVPYNEGAPTMMDVLGYMADRDLVPLDISGFTRPNGLDLAQIDVLFTRTSSPLRRKFFHFAG